VIPLPGTIRITKGIAVLAHTPPSGIAAGEQRPQTEGALPSGPRVDLPPLRGLGPRRDGPGMSVQGDLPERVSPLPGAVSPPVSTGHPE
jgi:hypothetical protein